MEHLQTPSLEELHRAFENEIHALLEKRRPPIEIRSQIDHVYSFQNFNLILAELKGSWNRPEVLQEYPFARARYIKTKRKWKIYCLRPTGTWEPYQPKPEVLRLTEVFNEVYRDPYKCFFNQKV